MGPQGVGTHPLPDMGHREWTLTPRHGTSGPQRGGYSPPTQHRIQRDTIGKRAVCILLECFLVGQCLVKFFSGNPVDVRGVHQALVLTIDIAQMLLLW